MSADFSARMRVGLLVVMAGLVSCGDPDPEISAEDAASLADPTSFDVWHEDFPQEVYQSPSNSGGWYERSRSQAMRLLVEKLRGNCTRRGWLMAKEYFDRAPQEILPIMIEAMDSAMQAPELADIVENTVEAMGRLGRFRSEEIAQALVRALQHQRQAVREKAVRSLVTAGSASSVRQAQVLVESMSGRGQGDWVRSVRTNLPEAEAIDIYSAMLSQSFGPQRRFRQITSVVLAETLKMSHAAGAQIVGPLWEVVPGESRFDAALILHVAGDRRGTRFFAEIIKHGDERGKALAVGAVMQGDASTMTDEILKLSIDEAASVRQAAAAAIAELSGENATHVLQTLAMDPATEVRQLALSSLVKRGDRPLLDRLIEIVKTGTGSKHRQAVGDLASASDKAALAAFYGRYKKSPADESRIYIQALGRSRLPEAMGPLREIFMGPERKIDDRGTLTTISYPGLLLPNLDGVGPAVLELFEELESGDYRRRGTLLHTLVNLVAVSDDVEFRRRTYDLFRRITLDLEEIPQMRLLAVDYLRRDVSLADMMAFQRQQRKETSEAMRKALAAYLFEYF